MESSAFKVAMYPRNLPMDEQSQHGDVRGSMMDIIAALKDLGRPEPLAPAAALPQAVEITDSDVFTSIEVVVANECDDCGTCVELVDDALVRAGVGVWLGTERHEGHRVATFEVVELENALEIAELALQNACHSVRTIRSAVKIAAA